MLLSNGDIFIKVRQLSLINNCLTSPLIVFRYERERQTRMIISRTATLRIKKSKEKVRIT